MPFIAMGTKGEESSKDIEEGHRSAPPTDDDDSSLCSSDAEYRTWHSPHSNCSNSACNEACRKSFVSNCSLEIDLESGIAEDKQSANKVERDCRICHLGLESAAQESGIPIELGCSCKEDLAAAHKQCAETWFKIKGNKTCEICGSTAQNVVLAGEAEVIEQSNETSSTITQSVPSSETRSFWQGHRLLNFLLACMVFAFVISWLFHFNVPG